MPKLIQAVELNCFAFAVSVKVCPDISPKLLDCPKPPLPVPMRPALLPVEEFVTSYELPQSFQSLNPLLKFELVTMLPLQAIAVKVPIVNNKLKIKVLFK